MLLEVEDVNVFYGDAHTLWDVSLHVDEGEAVSIVGSNGAGKTTLVNAIMGMQMIRSGRVMVDGVDVSQLAPHQVGDHGVGIVPEGRRIFPDMSVRDNLDLGAYRHEHRARHDEHLARVHELFPILANRSNQLAGSLSGGEQQQLAIGRALMSDPRILLLDEPSLGLAPVLVDDLFEVLAEVKRSGVTLLLVEQNVSRALGFSDRGYLLSEGRIALEGDPETLMEDETVRKATLGV